MLRINPIGTDTSIVFTERGGIVMGTVQDINRWVDDSREVGNTKAVILGKSEMKRVVMHMLMEIF